MSVFLKGMSDDQKRAAIAELPQDKITAILTRALPGLRVDHTGSLPDALAHVSADFRVEKRPLMAVLDADNAVEVPNRYATVRLDTGEPLGVVGTGYTVSQTLAQLAPVAVLIERGDAQLATLGVVNGGSKVRVSAYLGQSVVGQLPHGQGPDVLAHFGLFEASHDGLSSTRGSLQTLRLVCLNGATAWDHVAKYNVRHTLNGEARVAEASRIMLGLNAEIEREVKTFQRLHSTPMHGSAFQAFARQLLDDVRGVTDSDAAEAKRTAEVIELCDLFANGQGNGGSTLWDGYNSVTEWIDHRVRKNGKPAHTFESSRFGQGNEIKSRALRMLAQ